MGVKTKAGLTLMLLCLAALALQGSVDRVGMGYTESGFKRALVTFAVARSLNGVISVAQGTEVAVQPAGVGINFTPGEILDPVNDLIERFSWVMLASTTSLGLQKVLLEIFSSPYFSYLLVGFMVLTLFFLWYRRDGWGPLRQFLFRATLLLLVLRFAVPVVALGSELLFSTFLHPQYEASTQEIERARDAIGKVNRTHGAAALPQDDSMLGRVREWYQSTRGQLDLDASLQSYKRAAAKVSEQLIQLIVIFVLQTVLLPLLFIWGIGHLLAAIVNGKWPVIAEDFVKDTK